MRSLKWTPVRPSFPVTLGGAAASLAVAIGVTASLLSPSEGSEEPKTKPGLAVTIAQVRDATLPLRIPASGTVAAVDEVILGSEVAGLSVAELTVDEGDRVKKGQVLARLNRSILDAQLAQMNAQIVGAQASAEETAANQRRAVELGERGFISKQSIDQRRSAAINARAQVATLSAQRDELLARLAQTVITAPVDGIIASRGVSQGQVVTNGTELFRIIRDGKLEWKAELPDYQLTQLSLLQHAQVSLGSGQAIDGQIRLIAQKIDERSRNGVVHVALPDDARLRAGMFARGEIVGGEMPALTVPQASVVTKDGESFVFTVTREGRAHQTKVEVGARSASLIEIRRGLARGNEVVLDGAGLLTDGDQVRVTQAEVTQREARAQ